MRGKKATISGAAGKSAAAHARKKLSELLGFMGVDLFNGEGNGVALSGESFGSDTLVVTEDAKKICNHRWMVFWLLLDKEFL